MSRTRSTAVALAAIAGGALLLRLAWLAWHGAGEITWDGAEYARIAQNLVAGKGYVGIRGHEMFVFPPLYSLAIAALLPVTRSGELAGTIVSLVAGTLLVLPIFHLAAMLYGRGAGIAAAVLTAVLPFTVELSTVVLADALFLTLAATGLWLLVRTVEGARPSDAAWCAIAFACAYLTRPEGMLLEGLALAVLVARAVVQREARRRAAVLVVAAAVPFAVLAAPYAWFLSANAGHVRVEGKSLLNLDIGLRMSRGMTYTQAADAIDEHLRRVGPELDDAYYFDPPGRTAPPLQTVLAFGARNTLRHAVEGAHLVRSRVLGGPVTVVLALLGLVAGPWARRRLGREAILLAYGCAIVAALAAVFHFWERYFVGFIPLLVVWAGRGIDVAAVFAARIVPGRRVLTAAPVALVAAFAVAALFSTRTGFTDDASTPVERQGGGWLAVHGRPGASILSISDQIAYYAGDRWSMLPYAPNEATALRYLAATHPAYVVLDREYAAERPYVVDWLDRGIPDPRARKLFALGDRAQPTLAVFAWDHRDGGV